MTSQASKQTGTPRFYPVIERGTPVSPAMARRVELIVIEDETSPSKDAGLPRLVEARQLPWWYEPVPHLSAGYRLNYTATQCVLSWFELHNESWNIWYDSTCEICLYLAYVLHYCAVPICTALYVHATRLLV